jgi:hypothetical protein
MAGSQDLYGGKLGRGYLGEVSAQDPRGIQKPSDVAPPQEMRRLLGRMEYIARGLTEEMLRIDAIGNRAFGPEPENAGGEAGIHAEPYGYVAEFDYILNDIESTIYRLGVAVKRLDRL